MVFNWVRMIHKNLKIYALSDATGDLANHLANSAIRQFPKYSADILRIPKIKDEASLLHYVKEAKHTESIIVYTFVSESMREKMIEYTQEFQVIAIDAIGPLLNALSNFFNEMPSTEPGLQYKLTQQYFKRTEALDFTVKHDDGLGLDTIRDSDVLLLGVSRTSKTPLSIYLAYQGYKCSNIPLVKDIPLPAVVDMMDPKKMIGLTISVTKLSNIRMERLKKLGRSDKENYAQLVHIKDEIKYAQDIFKKYKIPVIDVTQKAIEESASEIINILSR